MPATEFANPVCVKHAPGGGCSLPLSMNRPFVLLLVLVIDSSSWLRGRGRGRARERLGSWSQCATEKSWRLPMNLLLSRPSGTLSPSEGERDGVRGPWVGSRVQGAHIVRGVLSLRQRVRGRGNRTASQRPAS